MTRGTGSWDALLDAAVRRVAGVGIPADASFFEAGLTSADLAAVHDHVCGLVGRELGIAVFFCHPTRRSLAAYLTEYGAGDGAGGTGGTVPAAPLPQRAGGPAPQAAAVPAATGPLARRELRARLRQRKG